MAPWLVAYWHGCIIVLYAEGLSVLYCAEGIVRGRGLPFILCDYVYFAYLTIAKMGSMM